MSSTNQHGQGDTHAVGGAANSKVPNTVQDKAPKGLEEALPDSVHPTESNAGKGKTHAKDGGNDSIVPKKVQEILPESVERAVPNAIHNTGDSDGIHRKK